MNSPLPTIATRATCGFDVFGSGYWYQIHSTTVHVIFFHELHNENAEVALGIRSGRSPRRGRLSTQIPSASRAENSIAQLNEIQRW